jgi:hypothetical protein
MRGKEAGGAGEWHLEGYFAHNNLCDR